jgi:hypothetical protein
MNRFINSIKQDFSTRTLVLIPIAIAINIVVGQLVIYLQLPLYLDSIGTVLVGALGGPWAGMLTGALSNIIWGSTLAPLSFWFFYVAAVIGLMAGIAGRMGLFNRTSPKWLSAVIGGTFFLALTLFILTLINLEVDPDEGFLILPNAVDMINQYIWVFIITVILGVLVGYFFMANAAYAGLAGLVTGVVAAIISAPTAAIVYGGVTGAGTDLLVAAFRASGANILAATLAQGSVSDPLDKMISFLVVWAIIQALPKRFRAR